MKVEIDFTEKEIKNLKVIQLEYRRLKYISLFFFIFSIVVVLLYSMPKYWGVEDEISFILNVYFSFVFVVSPIIYFGVFYSNPSAYIRRILSEFYLKSKIEESKRGE